MSRVGIALSSALLIGLAAGQPAAGQEWRTLVQTRRLGAQAGFDVKLEYAAGRVEIGPAAEGLLYRLESKHDIRYFDLDSDYSETDREARLRVELEGADRFEIKQIAKKNLGAGSLRLGLSKAVPLSLALDIGAAEAQLDLGGLRLRRIRLETGASDTHVRFDAPNPEGAEQCSFRAGAASFRIEGLGNSGCREMVFEGGVGSLELEFSGDWNHDATARIDVGLGSLGIRIPHDLGVRIEKRAFLMALNAPDFVKEGDDLVSENWSSATHRLTLRINGALGTIRVIRD